MNPVRKIPTNIIKDFGSKFLTLINNFKWDKMNKRF